MTKHTVLIVEDEGPLLQALTTQFAGKEFDVFQAHNGSEGLEQAAKNKPEIILLDLNMPKMDGATFMEHLRQDEWGKDVPVIILTNLQPDDTIINSLARTNPAYYLIKAEWDLAGIVDKVMEVLQSHPA
ncbi:MAG: KDP operon transcriptional regulatory protein KdpE [candidate division WS6 bacterium OLB20]|uniref:KDP operon transcriptional regulatory protein KdpE n=1 Tax=candidate division WS6 bacterium OLB20 TaxID=1617426 RepID=A0A136LY12_9BACT|nr:MAG: KDP operon transcriptional regulatory protein KdpE [candidate division WS6 bacterium OLB20]